MGDLSSASLRATALVQVQEELPAGAGLSIVRARCSTCHGSALIVQQRLSREGWSREIDKMVGWGAAVESGERDALLDYLAANFGGARAAAAGESANGAALLTSRCQGCHDVHLVDQQRLDAAGWRRELDKMIGWGAAVNDAEKEILAAYLSSRTVR